MKMKKGNIFIKISCAFLFCVIACMGFCEAVTEDLTSSIVRLHVIANSNSQRDQEVKLKVRDIILKEATALSGEAEWSLSLAQQHREALTAAANAYLGQQNLGYTCRIETGRFSFPAKTYENITLPQGEYDAVRVILGEGQGENWWCVMYPPLCFAGSAKGVVPEEMLEKVLSPASGAVILQEHITLKPALKCVELWQTLKKKADFAKKG